MCKIITTRSNDSGLDYRLKNNHFLQLFRLVEIKWISNGKSNVSGQVHGEIRVQYACRSLSNCREAPSLEKLYRSSGKKISTSLSLHELLDFDELLFTTAKTASYRFK